MTSSGDINSTVLAQRYQLDERIGAGSMGTVWRGTDTLLGRTVAVKQLLLQPGLDVQSPECEEARQRILREGRLAARLQHPHVIAVFDVVLHDDVPWLVMEYLASRTLNALLAAEGPLDPVQAAAIGRQVADGLAAAHAAGIVHRDVKPGNILIGLDGMVKITDFGVSRAVDDVQLTRTGLIAGTPAYLAPEVARGQLPTSASDLFALGSTLYAAVEGEPPFGLDDNAYALLHAVSEGEVRPPAQAGPLTATLMWMLRKEPEQRPTASAASVALASVAAGGVPAGALMPDPTQRVPEMGTVGGGGTWIDFAPPVAATRVGMSSGTAYAPVPPATEPELPSLRRRWGSVLAVGAAVLLLLVGVVIAIVRPSFTGRQQALQTPPLAQPSTTPPSVTDHPLPTTEPTVPSQSSPTAAQLEQFVRSYYTLLPGDTEQAWAMLDAQARQENGGLARYRQFFSKVSRITFRQGPTAVDDQTVEAVLQFEFTDGVPDAPVSYRFTVLPGPDGQLFMHSADRS
ncbi:MAG: protein kinase [Pseudonocardia sp.]|nr:protein kinase [Pseudonocardia sp.]